MNIYIYVRDINYEIFEDYILSINTLLNANIICYNDELENKENNILKLLSNNNNIIIIINKIPIYLIEIVNINFKHCFFLNTEQLTASQNINYIKDNINNKFNIIDYSKENINILNNNNIMNIIYFPYLYNDNEILNIKKINNICTMNPVKNHRINIMNNLKNNNIQINYINGWRIKRDNKLFSHKILLNISARSNFHIFETIRCNRCLFNKMIIISDKKYKHELIDYSEHILFVDIEELETKINDVIANYEKYYKLLNIDNINIHLNDHLISKDVLLKYI
jgi:hypothetical protein